MRWSEFNPRHKAVLDHYLAKTNECSNINYVNFLLWHHQRHYQICRHSEQLTIRFRQNQQWKYYFPLTYGKVSHALTQLAQAEKSQSIVFDSINATQMLALKQHPLYSISSHHIDRDHADYIYSIDGLITLEGQAYRAKRNFCRQYDKHYGMSYLQIDSNNLYLARSFLTDWFALKTTEAAQQEWQGIRHFLDQYTGTDCIGGMLLVKGQVVAVTFGEALNQDTVVIHIEKANTDYRGAYQAINRAYLQEHWSEYRYVNREQDLGVDGLRKAKMSYHPVRFVEKITVISQLTRDPKGIPSGSRLALTV